MGGGKVKRRKQSDDVVESQLRRHILKQFGVDVGEARVIKADAYQEPVEVLTNGPWREFRPGPVVDLTLKLQIDVG